MPVHLATNLKVLRSVMGWSQNDVAEMANVKHSSYSGYENGTAEPSLTTLLLLRDALRMPLQYLIEMDLQLCPRSWVEMEQRRHQLAKEAGKE